MPRYPLLTTSGTYDRRAIMALAWQVAREMVADGDTLSVSIKYAMGFAWRRAKEHRGAFEAEAGRPCTVFTIVRAEQAPEYSDSFEQWVCDARRLAA